MKLRSLFARKWVASICHARGSGLILAFAAGLLKSGECVVGVQRLDFVGDDFRFVFVLSFVLMLSLFCCGIGGWLSGVRRLELGDRPRASLIVLSSSSSSSSSLLLFSSSSFVVIVVVAGEFRAPS